jgi:hypothetical protein
VQYELKAFLYGLNIGENGWLFLLTACVLISALVAWSFIGTVSYTVTSIGLLIRDGEVFDVLSTQAEQLIKVHVKEGDTVQPGQEVGLIDQTDIEKALNILKEDLVDIEKKFEEQRLVFNRQINDKRRKIEKVQKQLYVVSYISVAEGRRVDSDMEMQVVPFFARPEEDGFVLGRVKSISKYPASLESIMKVTRNASLAEKLLATGPVYEVRGRLIPDPGTVSGFKWSRTKGSGYPIQSGTYCTVLIVVKKIHPYELVIPAIRSVLGDARPEANRQ